MEAKFTRGPFETMANMKESVCKKNDDGTLRWGCRVIPAVLDGRADDDDIRRRECAAVATLFQASPLLYEALKAATEAYAYHYGEDCPLTIKCRNALRVARGEE